MTEQAADNSAGVPRGFRIGPVFNCSFGIYGRNFLPFFCGLRDHYLTQFVLRPEHGRIHSPGEHDGRTQPHARHLR